MKKKKQKDGDLWRGTKALSEELFCYSRLINNMNIFNSHTGTDISKATLRFKCCGIFPV